MSSLIGLVKRVYAVIYPPIAVKASDSDPHHKPIKFGILGAARIAPPALISPAKSHSEAVVHAVAARDKAKAEAFAKKHGIPKVYGGTNGYQELIDDPEIDAIYNPLPNGLHYEWTMKALAAGKHVLLEKPSADTAAETRQMFELAYQNGLVLLEAFHYRFHPAIQRAKAIIDSGELGAVKSVSSSLAIPKGFMQDDDIRFDYALGGGALMDMGCYTINSIRYLTSLNTLTEVADVISSSRPTKLANASQVDDTTTAHLYLPNNVTATLHCSLGLPPWGFGPFKFLPHMPRIKVKVSCEGGDVEVFAWVLPTIYHYITVTKREGNVKKTKTEKVYKPAEGTGEDWWTTYRYQLEAFVDKVKGRTPQHWISAEDSIANMEWIEKIYEKNGMGSRPASNFTLP